MPNCAWLSSVQLPLTYVIGSHESKTIACMLRTSRKGVLCLLEELCFNMLCHGSDSIWSTCLQLCTIDEVQHKKSEEAGYSLAGP